MLVMYWLLVLHWVIFKSFIVPTLVPRALTAAMCQSLANFPCARMRL